MDAVRTPLDHTVALALGNRRYRKQVIKLGDVHYRGGIFPVTPAYLDQVMRAFDAKAIAKVPFQLADHAGRHTKDPLRRFGTVCALHRTDEGLDAVIELDDEAARLVDADSDFGVSVLIEHDRTTGEGAHYPSVLTHVLGTTDPILTSLRPWQPELAASHDAGQVLDLLALTNPEDPTKEGPTMPDTAPALLTAEETAQLRALLPRLAALPDPAATPAPKTEPKVDDEPELTDDELDKLAADILADDEDTEIVTEPLAAAHGDDPHVLALSQRLADTEQARKDDALALSQLRAERDETRYLAERDTLARKFGVHPRITDIVRPLLEGAGSKLALTNGGEVDPAELVRRFVRELASTPRLDLSQAKGTALDDDPDDPDVRRRDLDAFVARARAELNH